MITAFGMVKNAADVIEGYIRCNAGIVDNFVLFDNMSTDRTRVILDCLIKEGFQIEIIPDREMAYTQNIKMTNLLYYCKSKYDSDVFIPIDDDEVVFCPDKILSMADIKQYLKTMRSSRNVLYLIWRNFLPTENDDYNEISVPRRQRFYAEEFTNPYLKCIIPNSVLLDYSFNLAMGNHSGNGSLVNDHVILDGLYMAHYPIRTIDQAISKVAIGWIANILNKNRDSEIGNHWRKMFTMIKSGYTSSDDFIKHMAMLYMGTTNNEINNVNMTFGPISFDDRFFEIKYTKKNEFDAVQNLLLFCEEVCRKKDIVLPSQFYESPAEVSEINDIFRELCIFIEPIAMDIALKE